MRRPAARYTPSIAWPDMTTSTFDKTLHRVQGLLAKAESTPYPEEATALMAKAQELMTRYAIDDALAQGGRAKGSQPEIRSFSIANPYASAKRSLLAAVAGANDVRVITGYQGSISLVGFASDLDVTEMLFASLLVQATREMYLAAANGHGGGRPRAFRHAFLISYGARIGSRLMQARRAATDDAEATTGQSLVPLFARRTGEVEAYLNEQFPALRTRRTTLSHGGGWAAGREAADRADIGHRGING